MGYVRRDASAVGADIAAILVDTSTTLDDLVDDLETRLTAARAGYLDNLSGGAVALATSVGTLVNTGGGTATLGGILGDVANSSIAARLTIVEGAVTNIANVGSPSYAAPSTYTLTTGNQTSGTVANVDSDNDVYHVHTDAAGTLSLIYDWTLEPDQQASSVIWRGRWNGTNDTLLFELYDWVAPGWVTWFTQAGVAGTTATSDFTKETSLVAKYTGTGANAGKVRCRISGSGLSSCVLSTDQLIVGKTTATGGIANGSTVTLAGSNTNKNYVGSNWTLALGTQDISGSYFEGAKQVTGTASGTTDVTFMDCVLGSGAAGVTLPPGRYIRCGFNTASGQAFVAASAGKYVFIDCYSYVAVGGASTPYFTFSGECPVMFRRYSGGANITLNNASSALTYEVIGGGNITCELAGADIEIRGNPRDITLTGIASTSTVRFVGQTGPISLAGADGDAYIYGHCGVITDSRTGSPTLTNTSASVANIANTALGGNVVSKTITHNGSASYTAFTVTGLVAVKVVGYITTALTNDAATTSVGTATSAAGLIAATAGTAMQTVNQVWVDNAPTKFETFPAAWSLIGDGEDIVVDGDVALVGGVVSLYCWYVPISAGASVVAA
jgi:hypothetical protein